MNAATVTVTRTYAQWLVIAVSVGQTYGVNSYQWNEMLTAAYADVSFRIWSLKDEAEQRVRGVQS